MSNIVLSVLRHAGENGDKTAIVNCSADGSKSYTYSELMRHVEAFALQLRHQGCRKGDRIIVFVPMSYETYVAILSVAYIGATVVFIDAWVDDKRLNESIGITKPKAAILSDGSGRAYDIPDSIKRMDCSALWQDGLEKSGLKAQPEDVDNEDEAIFAFTTGSTGMPKAARRTHGYFLTQHAILSKYLGHKPGEINMVTFPIFLLGNLMSGITSVIPEFNPAEPSNVDCGWIARTVPQLNINSMTGSTALFEKLSSFIKSGGEKVAIEKIVIGGSPVFPSIAQKLCEAFPYTDIRVIYGATEAVPICMNSVGNISLANTSYGLPVGKVVDELDLKIIKPIDGPIMIDSKDGLDSYTLQDGEIGEIIISGPHVLREYVNNPEANKFFKIYDGQRLWHRTGDAGSIDGQGSLLFFGRVKNRLNAKGKDFYPLPLENLLLCVKGIEFAAVVQIEGRIIAVLELLKKQGVLQDEVLKSIRGLGLDFVDDFIVFDRIPRDPRHNSKANYEELRKYLSKPDNV